MSGRAPLRVVLVGAGLMGRQWLEVLRDHDDVELAGLADLEVRTAEEALAAAGLPAVPVAPSLETLLDRVRADFMVDVTIPEAHHAVTLAALRRGLPVLGEKPLAADLAEALELVAAAEAHDRLFMVSQSRRYNPELFAFRREVARLGRLGILVTNFFKAPRFGGFRDAMDHPLILDMAIHAFDGARFVAAAEPVAVYCEEYNPRWSWYDGDASATAVFEMSDDIRYVFTGSWCSEGLETSWNGAWRASGEHGSAMWDGEGAPAPGGGREDGAPADPLPGIAGSLAEFVAALRTGSRPMGECHDNVMSLAMVHAAIASSRTRQRVAVADVMERAHAKALARSGGPVRERLAAWTSLTPPAPARGRTSVLT